MIVIVLGMHKSGTTLIAKTLHESGINMGAVKTGNYPKCKYEDLEASKITKSMLFGTERRHSLQIPEEDTIKIHSYEYISMMKDFVLKRMMAHKYDWGFKFPDVTLCYDAWKQVLPYHVAIGVKRDREAIISHYKRRKTRVHTIDEINRACDLYEYTLDSYGVPIVQYEHYVKHGPGVLSALLGIKLKDCRR